MERKGKEGKGKDARVKFSDLHNGLTEVQRTERAAAVNTETRRHASGWDLPKALETRLEEGQRRQREPLRPRCMTAKVYQLTRSKARTVKGLYPDVEARSC